MRTIFVFSTIVLAAGLAAGQVSVVSGYASNAGPAVGTYAAPFVPLVTTPSITLDAAPFSNRLFAQPTWYGPAPVVQVEVPNVSTSQTAPQEPGFRFGAARFQSSYGAAELAAGARASQNTGKVYTNQDIPKPSLSVGTVKFGDKTEHLD